MTHSYLLAQIINPVLPPAVGSGAKENGAVVVGKMVGSIAGMIFLLAFLLSFFFLVTGGISWITAGGDKNQLETARNKIIHSVVGLIIIASLWAVMGLIGPWIGFANFPKLPFPTVEDVGTQQNPAAQPNVAPPAKQSTPM
jgi:hypothetical protein